MPDYILNLIHSYGYVTLYISMALGIVGLPIPDETILAFSGFLIFQKKLNLTLALLSCLSGSITGISISYLIGKKLGGEFLYRDYTFFHVSREKLDKTNTWIRRYGSWLFFFGYFIPGVRHLTALIAGASKTSYKKFAVYFLPGGVLWVSIFISLGFYAGKKWENITSSIQENILIFFFCVVIILAAVLLARKLLKILKIKKVSYKR